MDTRKEECLQWAHTEYYSRCLEDMGSVIELTDASISIDDIESLFEAFNADTTYLVVNNEVVLENGVPMLMSLEEAQNTKNELLKKDMLLKVDLVTP